MKTILATIKKDKGGRFTTFIPKGNDLQYIKVILDESKVPFKSTRAVLCEISYFEQDGEIFVSYVKKAASLGSLVLSFRSKRSTVLVLNTTPRQMIIFTKKKVEHYVAKVPTPNYSFSPHKFEYSQSEWKPTVLLETPSMENWKDILEDLYEFKISNLIHQKARFRSNIYNSILDSAIKSRLNRLPLRSLNTSYTKPSKVTVCKTYPPVKQEETWF